jgi:hypothetical protein
MRCQAVPASWRVGSHGSERVVETGDYFAGGGVFVEGAGVEGAGGTLVAVAGGLLVAVVTLLSCGEQPVMNTNEQMTAIQRAIVFIIISIF